MEGRILEVVVVCGNKDGQDQQGDSESDSIGGGLPMAEGCVKHDAGCVDHGEFVNQLPRICGRMSVANQSDSEGKLYT